MSFDDRQQPRRRRRAQDKPQSRQEFEFDGLGSQASDAFSGLVLDDVEDAVVEDAEGRHLPVLARPDVFAGEPNHSRPALPDEADGSLDWADFAPTTVATAAAQPAAPAPVLVQAQPDFETQLEAGEAEAAEPPQPVQPPQPRDEAEAAEPETDTRRKDVWVEAQQAYLLGDKALSLLNPKVADKVDELDGVFSAMGVVGAGEFAAFEVTLRAVDAKGFRRHTDAFERALRTGQPAKSGSLLSTAWAVTEWALRNALFQLAGFGQPSPWPLGRKKAEPLKATDRSAEANQQIEDAKRKGDADTYFEAAVRCYAGGPARLRERHAQRVTRMTRQFGHLRTKHQGLGFEKCDYRAALHGVLPVHGDTGVIVSAEEGCEAWHIPDDETKPHGIRLDRSEVMWLDPTDPLVVEEPLDPKPGLLPIGRIDVNSDAPRVVALNNAVLDRHALITGVTGTGKSECVQHQVLGAVKDDYPVIVVDPHGALCDDTVRNIIKHAPEHLHRLVVVDVAARYWPIGLNPLDVSHEDDVETATTGVLELLEAQMDLSGSSAPRAINLAGLAVTALCEANLVLREIEGAPLCTLLHITRFFADVDFRRLVCEFSKNPGVRGAFDPETGTFELLGERQQAEYAQPLARALQPLERSPLFSSVLGSSYNKLDWAKLMADNRIVIVRLAAMSKQKALGEFLGQLLLPMLRATMEQWGRRKDPDTGEFVGRGCRVFIDEAPTVICSDDSAERLTSEARKYDIGCIFVAQYVDQLLERGGPSLKNGVLINTVTKLALAQPLASAQSLGKEMGVPGEVIADLPPYHAIVQSPTGKGRPGRPYTVQLLYPLGETEPLRPINTAQVKRLKAEVEQRSRGELANSREAVQRDVLTALPRIKDALGLALVERTDADIDPSSHGGPNIAGGFLGADRWEGAGFSEDELLDGAGLGDGR